jgi:hypothetical protein
MIRIGQDRTITTRKQATPLSGHSAMRATAVPVSGPTDQREGTQPTELRARPNRPAIALPSGGRHRRTPSSLIAELRPT